MIDKIIVAGIDLYERYGIRLTGDSRLNPPKAKRYTLGNPGGDGELDITEVFGDTLYENRNDSLIFFVPVESASEFEKLKSRVMGFLHGREYDYVFSFDPGFVYHGRFEVDEHYSKMHFGQIKTTVTANPYKSAGTRIIEVDAQAGAHLTLNPGRGRVSPIFESKMPIHVISNGVDAKLPAGSHRAVGLSIRAGQSEVYVNTGGFEKGGNTTWADLKGKTWADLKDKRWYEVMWLKAPPAPSEAYKVKIAYEVLEL